MDGLSTKTFGNPPMFAMTSMAGYILNIPSLQYLTVPIAYTGMDARFTGPLPLKSAFNTSQDGFPRLAQ